MSTYHRYQPIYGSEQHLYCEGCPVYVHRYQISTDLRTGGRILQVRMVNMSEWDISTVYLRISCLDGAGRALTTMYAVPLTNLNVPRGRLFGENYTLRLSSNMTQLVQVFPERVIFSNGMAWNETETAAYVTLPAPIPVRRTDVDYDRLEQQGQRSGVHNDFRYQELENAWYCTCGLPNGQRRQFCGYCGTNREWLRLNMNGRAAIVKKAPKPIVQPEPDPEPVPAEPEPEPVPEPAPAEPEKLVNEPLTLSNDASVAELLDYMNQKLEQYGTPASTPAPAPIYHQTTPEEEFPVIRPIEQKKNRAGKVIGIVLLILAIAATIGFCAYRFLLPQLRYNQANTLEISGSYAEARAIFEELGEFNDAPERVTGTWYQEALAKMRGGDYAGAYQTFSTLEGFENSNGYAADCLYSLGVLAFNNGATDEAWNYVQQLQAEFPDYEGGQDLLQSCCYSFGDKAMNGNQFEQAKQWFTQAGDYKNAADLIIYCDYELACEARDSGDYALAVDLFRECTYGDSAEQMTACMMYYVENNGSREDPKTAEYLDELYAQDYPGAADLYEEMYAWTVTVKASLLTQDDQAVEECKQTDSPDKLYFHYSIEGGHPDETMTVVVIYTLPDGTSGNTFLIEDAAGGMSGTASWKDLQIPAFEGTGTLKLKFCNSETGEELHAVDIEIKAAE